MFTRPTRINSPTLISAVALAFAAIVAPALAHAAQETLYVATNGSTTSSCTSASPCTMLRARDYARTISQTSGDIVIELATGTYSGANHLPLVLDGNSDSGRNGYRIIYQAAADATPILSGGTTLSGWTAYNSTRYYASLASATRDVYVDSGSGFQRAPVAHGWEGSFSGWTKTSTGFTTGSQNLSSWGNKTYIELVSENQWMHTRCRASSITSTAFDLQSSCWSLANSMGDQIPSSSTLVRLENAWELLGNNPETWYRCPATAACTSGKLYYQVASGNMTGKTVVAGTSEYLLTASNQLHDVTFTGLTFRFTTWLEPSAAAGYVAWQTGVREVVAGTPTKTPATVRLGNAKNVTVDTNTFEHLGGVGVDLDSGSQNNLIVNNTFSDLASSAITIGSANDSDALQTDPSLQTLSNTFQNNTVNGRGYDAIYSDAAGVAVFYAKGTLIKSNTINSVSYAGISAGWGWDYMNGQPGYYPANNNIIQNEIVSPMMRLNDGGGIYALGGMPDSQITGNYAQLGSTLFDGFNIIGIYLDQGSQYVTVQNNVLYWYPGNYSIVVQNYFGTPSENAIYNTVASPNYSDVTTISCDPIWNTCDVPLADSPPWSSEAQAIIACAGAGASC